MRLLYENWQQFIVENKDSKRVAKAVIYIDDKWLYKQEDDLAPIVEIDLKTQKPKITSQGKDLTIVASGNTNE